MTPPDSPSPSWAGGLERLGTDGLARVFAIADAEGIDAAMREAFSRDVGLVQLFRITGRADWRFLLPPHGHERAVVLGSGLGGTAFDLSEDYGEVASCERSADALAWQRRVASQGTFSNVRIVAAQSELTPLPDGCADLVAIENGVGESPMTVRGEDGEASAGAAVREAARLLKDGGWLHWGLANRLAWPLSRLRRADGAGIRFAPTGIRELLAREGMADVTLHWVRPDLLTPLNCGWLEDSRTFLEFVRMRRVRSVNEAIGTVGLNLLGWTRAYRRIMPHLLVFARRSRSSHSRVPPRPEAPPQPEFVASVEHLLAGQGRKVEGLQAMLVQSNHNARGRVTYYLFAPGRRRPSHVVKLGRTRRSKAAVAEEARAYQSLIESSDFVRRQRPRSYHLAQESTFVLEDFVAGQTLNKLRGSAVYEPRALDWLLAFQSASAGGPLRRVDLEARLQRLVDVADDDAFRELAKGTARKVMAAPDFEVDAVPVHGDFTASNILLDGKDLYVIDWEWLRLGGWPLEDLWWYFIVSTRDASGTVGGAGAERVLDVLTGRGPQASTVRDLARGFASARRVPPILVPVFAIVTLLDMTVRWKNERRVDLQTAAMGEYETALRGLLTHEDRFWEFWGQDRETGLRPGSV